MKGAIGVIVPAILVLVIILVVAGLIYQLGFKQTEKTFFGKIWNKIFPQKDKEGGGSLGVGCPTIDIDGVDLLAQAMLDCWCMGQGCGKTSGLRHEIPCCYNISTNKLKTTITESTLRNALKNKGSDGKYIATATARGVMWNIGTLSPKDSNFVVCYDNDGWNEVWATRTQTATNCD